MDLGAIGAERTGVEPNRPESTRMNQETTISWNDWIGTWPERAKTDHILDSVGLEPLETRRTWICLRTCNSPRRCKHEQGTVMMLFTRFWDLDSNQLPSDVTTPISLATFKRKGTAFRNQFSQFLFLFSIREAARKQPWDPEPGMIEIYTEDKKNSPQQLRSINK